MTDAVRTRSATAVRTQAALVDDALAQLGVPSPVRGRAAPGTLPVPIGSPVATAGGETWVVVGHDEDAGRGALLLARRAEDGGIERTRRSLREVAEHSVGLLDGPVRDADGRSWYLRSGSAEDVARLGRAAPVIASARGEAPVTRTWGEVLDASGLAARAPHLLAASDVHGASRLRELVGDRHLVVSNVALPRGAPALIGTESTPGRAGAAAILAELDATQRWFGAHVGIDVFGPDRRVVVTTDDVNALGCGASATLDDTGTAQVREGPRATRVREGFLAQLSPVAVDEVRRMDRLFDGHALAERTHEATHVAQALHWGSPTSRAAALAGWSAAAAAEERMIGEALADAVGAARSGRASVFGRDMANAPTGVRTLAQYRAELDATIAAGTDDAHGGVQLLTAPLHDFGERLGGRAVASITGSAIRSTGADLAAGRVSSLDVPHVAAALRDAAAIRFGAGSGAVQALDQAWRAIGVLR